MMIFRSIDSRHFPWGTSLMASPNERMIPCGLQAPCLQASASPCSLGVSMCPFVLLIGGGQGLRRDLTLQPRAGDLASNSGRGLKPEAVAPGGHEACLQV